MRERDARREKRSGRRAQQTGRKSGNGSWAACAEVAAARLTKCTTYMYIMDRYDVQRQKDEVNRLQWRAHRLPDDDCYTVMRYVYIDIVLCVRLRGVAAYIVCMPCGADFRAFDACGGFGGKLEG